MDFGECGRASRMPLAIHSVYKICHYRVGYNPLSPLLYCYKTSYDLEIRWVGKGFVL